MRRGLTIAGTVAAAVAIVTALVHFGMSHYNVVTETSLQPLAVLQDPGVDPRTVQVGVTWIQEGWCVGEFHVKASETSSQVKIDSVIDRQSSTGYCAGVGAVNQMAWADLQLATPLGTRAVVRGDGSTLPYWTSSDGLVRKGPSSVDISHYGGLNDTPRFQLRKAVTVTDPVELSQLVDELDALPPFPAGTMYCPLDDGSYYVIVIRYVNGGDTTIKASGGCEPISLAPSNRVVAWAPKSPGFYPLLAGLLGE